MQLIALLLRHRLEFLKITVFFNREVDREFVVEVVGIILELFALVDRCAELFLDVWIQH